MKESVLRTKVAKRRDVPDQTWEYIRNQGFLEVAEEEIGEAEGDLVGYLVLEIDKLADAASVRSHGQFRGGRTGQELYLFYLRDHEKERIEVKAQVLAKHALADYRVRTYRDRFLGGESLAPEQAQAFVSSLANQHLPARWFDEHDVSYTDHTIHSQTSGPSGHFATIEFVVEPAGIECRVEKNSLSEEYSGGMLSVSGDPDYIASKRLKHTSLPTPDDVELACADLPDLGYWRGFTGYIRADSPLGELRDLGTYLKKRYAGWEANYATRFVLTGEAPPLRPLLVDTHGRTITINVEPWISAASVQKAYRHALWRRANQTKRFGGAHSSRWNRRISDKNLKLLHFVTTRIDHRGQLPTGRDLVREWDEEYPEWAYRGTLAPCGAITTALCSKWPRWRVE